MERAKTAGIPVSFDVNYRSKLWSPEEAAATLTPVVQGIDLFFCGRNDAKLVFGCEGEPEDVVRKLADLTRAKVVIMSLAERGVIAWNGGEFFRAAALPVQIIDRPGAGDGLAAGVIHGWLDGDLQRGLQTGVVLAALALSQHGDMIVTTREEVESLMQASGATLVR